MKKFLIILAFFTFVPFAHPAAVDEGAELAARQVLFAPEGEQGEDDVALQIAIAESMQMQKKAEPDAVEAASSQTPEERAREQVGERQKVEPVFADIRKEKKFNVDIAAIQAASGTIKDVTEDIAPGNQDQLTEAVQTGLQSAIESIALDDAQTEALLGALVIDNEGVMRAYLDGLDKEARIALLRAANYLNVPLLQMMSQQSLEGVLTQKDLNVLPFEYGLHRYSRRTLMMH